MRKSVVLFFTLILLCTLALGVEAKGPKKAPPGLVTEETQTQTDLDFYLYLSDAGFSSDEQTALYFILNLSGFQTGADEVTAFWRTDPSWLEITLRLGYPPVLLDGELLVWRHPLILHSPLPLVRERHRHRFEYSWGFEYLDRDRDKYDYAYEDKLRGIRERIEVKPQKYSYMYQSKTIEERLEIQVAANKYEYTYRNRLTGEDIRKSGKTQFISWRDIPKYLAPEKPQPTINFKLELHFDFD